MGKLVLFLKDASPVEIPLAKERVTIGRRPDNDVCLPYPAVSGEHAAVVTILADSFLEDLGSTNGTLVNGRPVAKHFLRDRDQIDIGRQLLVYLADADAKADVPTGVAAREDRRELIRRTETARAPVRAEPASSSPVDDDLGAALQANEAAQPQARPPEPVEHKRVPSEADGTNDRDGSFDDDLVAIRRTRVDSAGPPSLPDEAPAPAPEPEPRRAPAPRAHARLLVLSGPGVGRIVPITRDEFVVGRIGMQVAAIEKRGDALVLVPREGAQPPTVNGQPVPADGRPIVPGDGLEVAGTRLELLGAE